MQVSFILETLLSRKIKDTKFRPYIISLLQHFIFMNFCKLNCLQIEKWCYNNCIRVHFKSELP